MWIDAAWMRKGDKLWNVGGYRKWQWIPFLNYMVAAMNIGNIASIYSYK
jgi:hypothetical protein